MTPKGVSNEDRTTAQGYTHACAHQHSRLAQHIAGASTHSGPCHAFTFESTCARLDLPIEEQEDGFLGWKLVIVRSCGWTNRERRWTSFCVQSKMFDETVALTAKARCRYHDHRAPWPTCACGFYACAERLTPYLTLALAEVELRGTVIEHEDPKGLPVWRGEYQRILSLEVAVNFPYNPLTVTQALGVEVRRPSDWDLMDSIQREFDTWMRNHDEQSE